MVNLRSNYQSMPLLMPSIIGSIIIIIIISILTDNTFTYGTDQKKAKKIKKLVTTKLTANKTRCKKVTNTWDISTSER